MQFWCSESWNAIAGNLKLTFHLDHSAGADQASLSVQAGRKDGTYLLPVCTQFETSGSRVASNRSLQWGEPIVPPSFESKDDYEVIYLMAKADIR
jgi:anaerobic selenocysteine-containing dehydrogenase